jgi:hypothetical protein
MGQKTYAVTFSKSTGGGGCEIHVQNGGGTKNKKGKRIDQEKVCINYAVKMVKIISFISYARSETTEQRDIQVCQKGEGQAG